MTYRDFACYVGFFARFSTASLIVLQPKAWRAQWKNISELGAQLISVYLADLQHEDAVRVIWRPLGQTSRRRKLWTLVFQVEFLMEPGQIRWWARHHGWSQRACWDYHLPYDLRRVLSNDITLGAREAQLPANKEAPSARRQAWALLKGAMEVNQVLRTSLALDRQNHGRSILCLLSKNHMV